MLPVGDSPRRSFLHHQAADRRTRFIDPKRGGGQFRRYVLSIFFPPFVSTLTRDTV
jgi:hypothetical protein